MASGPDDEKRPVDVIDRAIDGKSAAASKEADAGRRTVEQSCVAESEIERLKRMETEIRSGISEFSASDRLSRDELYERRR